MCVGFVWRHSSQCALSIVLLWPVRDPDLDSSTKSVLPQLCLALQGGCSALASERMCICVCAFNVRLLLFVLGRYCCCSLSWEVGLTTFLFGSLEPSRNRHAPILLQRLNSSFLVYLFFFAEGTLLPLVAQSPVLLWTNLCGSLSIYVFVLVLCLCECLTILQE